MRVAKEYSYRARDVAGDGWVLVLPDADRPLFHVLAESRSKDAAQALAGELQKRGHGIVVMTDARFKNYATAFPNARIEAVPRP